MLTPTCHSPCVIRPKLSNTHYSLSCCLSHDCNTPSTFTPPGAPSQPSLRMPALATPKKVPAFTKVSTCFQLKNHPVYPTLGAPEQTCRQGSVEEEFWKYASGTLSAPETNLLMFWVVSHSSYYCTVTDPPLCRQIRLSFPLSLWSL